MKTKTILLVSFLVLAIAGIAQAYTITTQPKSQNVMYGASFTLTVAATGTPTPISYQWAKDGAALPGKTTSKLIIPAAFLADAGTYTVRVGGALTSASAIINIKPAITLQPAGLSVPAGESFTLSVSAVGSGTLTYTWKRSGLTLAGATNSSLTVTSANYTNAGSYTVVVSSPYGYITSLPASVVVGPEITRQPLPTNNVARGRSLSLALAAKGSAPLKYQWFFNGEPLTGKTNATLGILAVTLANAGTYTCTVSNKAASVSSTAALVNIGPMITAQPIGTNVPSGSAFSLSVAAVGSSPLSYVWKRGTAALVTNSSPTYTVNSASLVNAGTYTVVVRGPGGVSAVSAPAVVRVGPAFSLTPAAVTNVMPGRTISLAVKAQGSLPLQYQWTFNGAPLAGKTNSSLSLPSVASANAGTYSCTVSNMAGTVSSSTILNIGPAILAQPVGRTVANGESFDLAVTASGSAPLNYTWQRGPSIVASGTSSSYSVSSAALEDAGSYRVIITNMAGSVTSLTAVVRMTPTLLSQTIGPVNVSNGGSFTLSVEAVGSAPLTYAWSRGTTRLIASGSSYSVASASITDAGEYRVVVSSPYGSFTSTPVLVNIGPRIYAQPPPSTNVAYHSSLTLSLGATGSSPMTYQWFHDGVSLPDATNAAYTISQVQSADQGAYTCTVSNPVGTVSSAAANIFVTPAVLSQSSDLNVAYQQAFSLEVTGAGPGPLGYQWSLNGSEITGATNATYAVASATVLHGGTYLCRISNDSGDALSSPIKVAIAPYITEQPVGADVSANTAFTLTTEISGSLPLTNQWYLNGNLLPGKTSPTLAVTAAKAQDGGDYTLVSCNSAGSVTSSVAVVNVGPVFTLQPQGGSVALSNSFTMLASASGYPLPTYQWFKDGNPIASATSSQLTIPAEASDYGRYWVVAENLVGSLSSAAVEIRIVPPRYTWLGGGTNHLWSTPGNWYCAAVPLNRKTDDVLLAPTEPDSSIYIDRHIKIRSLTVASNAGSITLTNDSVNPYNPQGSSWVEDLHIEAGITNLSDGTLYLSCPVWQDNAGAWVGNITIAGLSGMVNAYNPGNPWSFSGKLSIQKGAYLNLTTLLGTMNGDITVSDGGILYINNGFLGNGYNGGFIADSTNSVPSIFTSTGNVIISNSASYTDDIAATIYVSGTWYHTGNVTMAGTATNNGSDACLTAGPTWLNYYSRAATSYEDPSTGSILITGNLISGDTIAATPGAIQVTGTWNNSALTRIFFSPGGWITFGNSRNETWSADVLVSDWVSPTLFTNANSFFVGTDGSGLTAEQLGRMTFTNASHFINSYPATILSTGEVVPDTGGK